MKLRKYPWLLLFVPLIAASLMWSSAALASCNFLSILASIGTGDGQVLTPRAVAVDPSGNVFVADQNDRVQKFNTSGVFQFKFATGGSSFGAVVAPQASQSIGQLEIFMYAMGSQNERVG